MLYNKNTTKLFSEIEEDPVFPDETLLAEINKEENLCEVETLIESPCRKLNNFSASLNKEESLQEILFDIIREPLPPFGKLMKLPGEIKFKSQLQRTMCEFNFKSIEYQSYYMDESKKREIKIEDKFMPFYDVIKDEIPKIDLTTLNEQENDTIKRIRYGITEGMGKIDIISSTFTYRFLEIVEKMIEAYCIAVNKLIEIQKSDYLKLYCFAHLNRKFMTSISQIADELHWFDVLFYTKYIENFKNEPKYPVFGVYKLALKIWNRSV